MNKKKTVLGAFIIVGLLLSIYASYQYGRHDERKITWYSELAARVHNGQKAYLIDAEVICSNGKDVGRIQVDLNLTNGKLRIVRNDSQLLPNCEK